MTNQDYKKRSHPHTGYSLRSQAAIELAVFGAIVIFILGTIVNAAMGNSYLQNQTLKGMRMALALSYDEIRADKKGNPSSIARNYASILFVEDRLSADVSKYGPLERTPEIANGSGTLSYELLYPLDAKEVKSNLPIMDVYINGQHFPFTTAAYTTTTLSSGMYTNEICCGPNSTGACLPIMPVRNQSDCARNQCLRNQREWAGGALGVSDFYDVAPPSPQAAQNANTIVTYLGIYGDIQPLGGGFIASSAFNTSGLSSGFKNWYKGTFAPSINDKADVGAQLKKIAKILSAHHSIQYKYFFTQQVNGTSQFSVNPPTSKGKDKELYSGMSLGFLNNAQGDVMYDLQRNGGRIINGDTGAEDDTYVQDNFPVDQCVVPGKTPPACPDAGDTTTIPCMRCAVAWQWAATAGTSDGVGVDASNNNYPLYDIDGRLKTVTIYNVGDVGSDGSVTVTYEDPQKGDIDPSWDINTCHPKPGLKADCQIFTFTKDGTYLQIKEGQLYNAETGKVVRSINQRDNVDLIQRMVQLSNNTGRFCTGSPPTKVASVDGIANPVEVCVGGTSTADSCFCSMSQSPQCNSGSDNIKQTCFDASDNMLYVRSRLEDRRGRFWMTNAAGPLGVQ